MSMVLQTYFPLHLLFSCLLPSPRELKEARGKVILCGLWPWEQNSPSALIPSISDLPPGLSQTPRAWYALWNVSQRHTDLPVHRLAAGTIPSRIFLLFISYSISRAGSKFSSTPMALFLQIPPQRSGPNQIPGSDTTPLTGLMTPPAQKNPDFVYFHSHLF